MFSLFKRSLPVIQNCQNVSSLSSFFIYLSLSLFPLFPYCVPAILWFIWFTYCYYKISNASCSCSLPLGDGVLLFSVFCSVLYMLTFGGKCLEYSCNGFLSGTCVLLFYILVAHITLLWSVMEGLQLESPGVGAVSCDCHGLHFSA